MMIEARKEQLADTQRIRERHKIVCKVSNNLNFKDLIMLRTPESGFYFEYKKHRNTMLKDKEPPKKEPYYVKYIREQKQLAAKLQKQKEKEERLRQIALKEAQELKRIEEIAEATLKNFSAQASLILHEKEENDRKAIQSENVTKIPS